MKLVLKRPIISEKSISQGDTNKYTFLVTAEADKTTVTKAIEEAYKVKVEKINIVNLPAKLKRRGKIKGVRAAKKKAIVTLKPGNKIALFEEKA